jgi:hypothetical protein
MKDEIDLIGQRFNKLVIIKKDENRDHHFICRCDCGNIKSINKYSIMNDKIKSCGCSKTWIKHDITGKKFGKLVVISFSHSDKNGTYWKCQCDCGNILIVRRSGLLMGRTKSCGCYKIEQNKQQKKFNRYILGTEYTTGFTEKEDSFIFETKFFDKIKPFYWSVRSNGYVYAYSNGKLIALHRFITDTPDDLVVDHINHDATDNRLVNLRICYDKENTRNRTIASNNKSGITGVYKDGKKWRAIIFYNGKNIHLGSHATIEEAAQARKQAEEKYFGEFAPR